MMILALELLGSNKSQVFRIEDTDHVSLARLAQFYLQMTEQKNVNTDSKGEKQIEYLFYSWAEKGFLNPNLALSKLLIASEDAILLIPAIRDQHRNPFESRKES